MHKKFLLIACLSGALVVILGAFGAHSLKKIIQPADLATFQTGVQYQVYHTFALLVTGILYERFRNRLIRWAGICFIIGILLFSGSLYTITFLKVHTSVDGGGIGLITPLGGLFFILGWISLFAGISKHRSS